MGKVHAASLRTKEVIQSSLRARTYASDTFSKVLGLSTTVVTEIRAGIVNRCEFVGDELQGDVDGEIWDVDRCSFAMQRGSLRTLSAHVHPLFSLARVIAPYNCSYGNGTVEYSIVFCNGESACVTSVSTVTPPSKAFAPNSLSMLIQTARFHMLERLKQPRTQMSR